MLVYKSPHRPALSPSLDSSLLPLHSVNDRILPSPTDNGPLRTRLFVGREAGGAASPASPRPQMLGLADSARRAYGDAEKCANAEERCQKYLDAARLFLQAAENTEDDSIIHGLLYLSNLSTTYANASRKLLEAKAGLLNVHIDTEEEGLESLPVLSNRLIFNSHLARLENISKIPKAAEPTAADIERDTRTVRSKLQDLGLRMPSLERLSSGEGDSDVLRSQMDHSFLLLPGPQAMSIFPVQSPLRSNTEATSGHTAPPSSGTAATEAAGAGPPISPVAATVGSTPEPQRSDWRSYLPIGWGHVASPPSHEASTALKSPTRLAWNDQSMMLSGQGTGPAPRSPPPPPSGTVMEVESKQLTHLIAALRSHNAALQSENQTLQQELAQQATLLPLRKEQQHALITRKEHLEKTVDGLVAKYALMKTEMEKKIRLLSKCRQFMATCSSSSSGSSDANLENLLQALAEVEQAAERERERERQKEREREREREASRSGSMLSPLSEARKNHIVRSQATPITEGHVPVRCPPSAYPAMGVGLGVGRSRNLSAATHKQNSSTTLAILQRSAAPTSVAQTKSTR